MILLDMQMKIETKAHELFMLKNPLVSLVRNSVKTVIGLCLKRTYLTSKMGQPEPIVIEPSTDHQGPCCYR